MYSGEEVGKALRTILNRLKETNFETDNNELPHTCNNCKYCHGVEGYDQQWGMTYCVHSWCDKDRNLMDSWKDRNNLNSHYLVPCEHFEYGNGKYDKMSEKERRRCGI